MSGAVRCARCSVAVRVRAPGRSLEPSTAIYGLKKAFHGSMLYLGAVERGMMLCSLRRARALPEHGAPRPGAAAGLLVGEPQAALVDEPLEVPAVLADERDGALVEAIEIHGAHERGVELGLALLEALAAAVRAGDELPRGGVPLGSVRFSKSKKAHGAILSAV